MKTTKKGSPKPPPFAPKGKPAAKPMPKKPTGGKQPCPPGMGY